MKLDQDMIVIFAQQVLPAASTCVGTSSATRVNFCGGFYRGFAPLCECVSLSGVLSSPAIGVALTQHRQRAHCGRNAAHAAGGKACTI
jgi:hypothetical protein